MTKFTLFFAAICVCFTMSCSVEDAPTTVESVQPFTISSSTYSTSSLDIILCETTTLIAGQNMDAGTVTVSRDFVNLYITYNATGDWKIDATHLSLGECAEQEIPTTGSGNPKIGQFDLAADHPDGTVEVTYIIPINEVPTDYCFAAHAEVSGPSSETAWAEGTPFDGNSWAMFFEATLSTCLVGDS